MNLNTLAKDVELQIVNNEHGWGVEVEYTIRRTNTTLPTLKAMFLEGHLGKNDDAHDADIDEATFLSLDLTARPEKGDIIKLNGVTWYVNYIIASNPYDVACVANERHATGRSRRRER